MEISIEQNKFDEGLGRDSISPFMRQMWYFVRLIDVETLYMTFVSKRKNKHVNDFIIKITVQNKCMIMLRI